MPPDNPRIASASPASARPSRPAGERRDWPGTAGRLAVAGGLGLAVFRIWCCVCFFPVQEWNDVRLRAAFLVADGLPLYPGLGSGLITTWIYGPVLPLLLLPVTFAGHYDTALLAAAAENALLLAGAVGFACLAWPAPANSRWSVTARLGALGVSLLLLPQTFFIFLQADNAALAAGLVSLTCLARAQSGGDRRWWWLAAGFAGVTAFSKLHGVALLAGELAWLWLAGSRRQAVAYGWRLLLAGGLGLLMTLRLSASPLAAWEMMIRIPSRLPFTTEWAARLQQLAPSFALMIVLPGIFAVRTLARDRPWSTALALPACAWLASLPLGVAGALTTGGTNNSLHGAFFLLPIALVEFFSRAFASPLQGGRLDPRLALCGLVALFVFQAATLGHLPLRPRLDLAQQAVAISARLGANAWLPWRPLATRFATGRQDHDEDGLHVRQLTALFPRREHARAGLPPAWDCTVLQATGMTWHIADTMLDGGFVPQQTGQWLVFSRPAADSGIGKAPATVHAPP